MRKILSTLMLLLTVAFLSKGQDVKPIDPINFKALQSPSWSYMTLDSAIWIYKGSTYGWTKIHGDTHLKRYYVPYDNALRNVNLGDKRITSTKQRLPLFNGACVVPTITDNGNGSITVSNGEYHLSTNTEGRGTENFLINGGTFALTDQTQNYLVADYNSGTPILKVITDVNLINETTVIPIYTAYRNGIFLHFQNWDSLGLALANKVHQSIVKTQRYRREYGLIVTEYGTHNLNMTEGRVWVGAVPVDIAEINTGVDNLSIWYHSGGNWVNSIQPTYNFTQWDNGTDLVTLTNNRHAVNWIFRGIENQKHLYIVLGRGDYSLVEAEASSMPPIPTAISSHATLVAKLIVEKNAATATNIKSAFEVQFSLASVQKHDDLTGRDVVNSHPASAISNTPAGNISSTNVQAAINELDTEKEPLLTKGLLTETVDGLELSSGGTRQVIGGAETITLTAGRVIPTTTNISHAETAYTHSQNDTDLSPTNEANTSLTYNQTTRVLSVTDPVATRSATLPLATTTVDGLMSKTDKTKLDAVPSSIDSLFALQFIGKSSILHGYLYNWYAATDSRNIANIGWRVSTGYSGDFSDLSTYLGGETIAGGKLKDKNSTFWNNPNTGATNEALFYGRGSGTRKADGTFNALKSFSYYFALNSGAVQVLGLQYNDDNSPIGSIGTNTIPYTRNGYSIRLVKESTTLTNGQTGEYIGNDGRVYKTICIGTKEWLAENLMETKYRNGDLIPEVTDNSAWAALTTGARCSYNNDYTLAFGDLISNRDITINDTIYFDKTILGNSSQLEPLRVDTTIIATKHYVDSSTGGTQTLSTNGSAGNISISSGNTITLNVNDHTNRTSLDNVSGVNTGDQTLSSLGGQTQLNGTGFVKASGTTISYDNSTYEPAFSKNTAFNKNFGTTTGTVLEGRTFGTAATNNTGDFILNQNSSAQNASIWVSGSGSFDGIINTNNAYKSHGLYALYRDDSDLRLYAGTNGFSVADASNGFSTFEVDDLGNAKVWNSINAPLYKLSGVDLFSSLTTGSRTKWDGTKLVDDTDTFAPASGSANYVQVSPTSAQVGNIWMNGTAKFGYNVSILSSSVVSGYIADAGDGTGTGGGFSRYATDGINKLFIGTETSAFGGISGGGLAFVYDNYPFHIATNGQKRFTVTGNGFSIFSSNTNSIVNNGVDRVQVDGSINTTGYRKDANLLLLDWLKSGSAPASGNIVVGNGTTTNPSGVSVNQAIGGNALSSGYVPYWNGSKLVNSTINKESEYTLRQYGRFWVTPQFNDNADYAFNVTGYAGAPNHIALFGQYGFSNGFTVDFNGSNMVYTMRNGNLILENLSGSGTRLVSATSDGTLGSNNITTDASNNLSGINNLTMSGDARINSLASDDKAEVSVFPDGTLTRKSIAPYIASSNSYTLNVAANVNAQLSATSDITITLSNISPGDRGVIEVVYTGASVVTFIVNSTLTLQIEDSIYNSTTNAYTKSVLSKSSGSAKYEYYRSGNNILGSKIFIDGKQNYQ